MNDTRFPGPRFHTAMNGRVAWYCIPQDVAKRQDVELAVNEAAHHVIERWMREKMLRFSSYDDGSDDLILAAEIARYAVARLSPSEGSGTE